jgi:O-antigen/teichoic acid export membrane protein
MPALAPLSKPAEAESVFRPAMVLMSGKTLAFVATFFIPVVLVRLFSPAEFGTYKQLFLIHTTLCLVAQVGMASSLYYFLPRASGDAGGYVVNSVLFLAATGSLAGSLLVLNGAAVSRWMSNIALQPYVAWIGLYLALTMAAAAMEIVMISRGRYVWASATYALSDLARAAMFLLPVLLTGDLHWLLAGAVAVALVRAVAAWTYFYREFHPLPAPSAALLAGQLRYAVPFGMAVLLEVLHTNLPFYAVSFRFDPATFAIFSVGCLQIPIVDFLVSPTSDVMMVRMQERLAAGRRRAVAAIWHDTTRKLALLFFPLVALLIVSARDIMVLLFTAQYAASAPIFMIWSLLILLAVFQVDGVLRVYASTRFLFVLHGVRLALLAVFIGWSMARLGLPGAALAAVASAATAKAIGLARLGRLLEARVPELLPWRALGGITAISAAAAAAALLARPLAGSAVTALLSAGATFVFVYGCLLWKFHLLNGDEKQQLTGWLRRLPGVRALAPVYPEA